MADYVKYHLDLGSFEGEEFKRKTMKEFNHREEAYKAYKKFVNEQMSYTDEELYNVWKSTRLDIELKQDNKLINRVGIYLRRKDTDKDEDEGETDS